VHGGERDGPAWLDEALLVEIEALIPLAPLHQPLALEGIRAARSMFGLDIPQVAVFDTSFHRAMPPVAASYALPAELAGRLAIRRYGFHGISHEYVCRRFAELTGVDPGEVNLISLHLGSGCSAAAIAGGRSVDTSMGFSPLEGLVMGTRSGDLDPSLVAYIAWREGLSADRVVELLNEESGLVGASGGRSSDVRALLEAEAAGDTGAAFALDLFAYRVRKYIGAYFAVLGRVDAIVFTGGVGEHQPAIRVRCLRGLDGLGVVLDGSANDAAVGVAAEVSGRGSAVGLWVVPTDEEHMIAVGTHGVVFGNASARAG
jgi:acetate kinase